MMQRRTTEPPGNGPQRASRGSDAMFKTIAIVLALVVAALGGYLLSGSYYGKGTTATVATATTAEEQWVAAAPGRVEPGSGEFRLGAAVIGKVADVPVK